MPTTATDRRTGLSTSVAVKAPCRVATTANITLFGLQTVDGVLLAAEDRVLVKDQTDATENGIWVVQSTAWTRARDFNGALDAVQGTVVRIVSGTENGGLWYGVTTDNPIVIGTTEMAWGYTNPQDIPLPLAVASGGTGAENAAAARSNLAVPGLETENSFGAAQTVADSLTVESSDAGAGEGPGFTLDRDSATPAASDLIGFVRWLFQDSAGNADEGLKLLGEITDPTSGSEDVRLLIQTMVAGTLATRGYAGAGLVWGSPTGGDKGAGSINAEKVWLDGTELNLPVLTKVYDSGPQAITANGLLELTHALGARPLIIETEYECVSNEAGYAAGETMDVSGLRGYPGSFGFNLRITDTQIKVMYSATPVAGSRADTGASFSGTPANWRLVVRAFAA